MMNMVTESKKLNIFSGSSVSKDLIFNLKKAPKARRAQIKRKEKSTFEMPNSSVLQKVKDFLPEIRKANNALPIDADGNTGSEKDSIVQLVEKNEPNDLVAEQSEAECQLNMDLTLFEYDSDSESDANEDPSDNDANSTIPEKSINEKKSQLSEAITSIFLKNGDGSESQSTKFSLRMPQT